MLIRGVMLLRCRAFLTHMRLLYEITWFVLQNLSRFAAYFSNERRHAFWLL
jgi:hypothetical protein